MAMAAVSLLFACQAVAQPVEGQYYQIKNLNSKMVLALDDGAGKVEGALIVQRSPAKYERRHWKFVKVGEFYKIINRHSGQALNVQNASGEEGAPIIQWDASDEGENQQWSLEEKKGNYRIKARHSGMVVDVADESKARQAGVIQMSQREGRSQLFQLVPVE